MKIIYFYVRDFIGFIIDIVGFIFDIIIKLVNVLSACFDWLYNVIGALPTVFLVSGMALIIISIIYKILGREGQD